MGCIEIADSALNLYEAIMGDAGEPYLNGSGIVEGSVSREVHVQRLSKRRQALDTLRANMHAVRNQVCPHVTTRRNQRRS